MSAEQDWATFEMDGEQYKAYLPRGKDGLVDLDKVARHMDDVLPGVRQRMMDSLTDDIVKEDAELLNKLDSAE